MLQITPNFHFNGNCKQAIELYKKAFNLEVKILFCYSDANPEDYVETDDKKKDLVYHSEVYIGNQRIMMTDVIGDNLPAGNSISLLITFDTANDIKKSYDILSEDAIIITPIKATTYSSCFVSLIDKYGMRWELMTEQTLV